MRSVFYGVLLTVFVAGAGYVQAANDEYERGISGEGPALKPMTPPEDLFGDEILLEDGTKIGDPNMVRRVEEEERKSQERRAAVMMEVWERTIGDMIFESWEDRVEYAEVAVRTLLGPRGMERFCNFK